MVVMPPSVPNASCQMLGGPPSGLKRGWWWCGRNANAGLWVWPLPTSWVGRYTSESAMAAWGVVHTRGVVLITDPRPVCGKLCRHDAFELYMLVAKTFHVQGMARTHNRRRRRLSLPGHAFPPTIHMRSFFRPNLPSPDQSKEKKAKPRHRYPIPAPFPTVDANKRFPCAVSKRGKRRRERCPRGGAQAVPRRFLSWAGSAGGNRRRASVPDASA